MERHKRRLLIDLAAGVLAAGIVFLGMGTSGRGLWAILVPAALIVAVAAVSLRKYWRARRGGPGDPEREKRRSGS
ncbi:hypothetical protein [Leucobacter sp. PH1c]|uniref:hypothetical protein n=1 Tax=Leucobacter sp. PH1c TaxID=1397278 RepID=UPI0012FE870B|nr:hypothetical protein [Leucobacter sp. PH1c]